MQLLSKQLAMNEYGFTDHPVHTRLLFHPRYPGFVFRVLDSFDEVAKMGAVMMLNHTTHVSYFGEDLPKGLAKPGHIGIPTKWKSIPIGDSRRCSSGEFADTMVSTDATGTYEFLNPSNIKLLGIVSRAQFGVIWMDLGTAFRGTRYITSISGDGTFSGNNRSQPAGQGVHINEWPQTGGCVGFYTEAHLPPLFPSMKASLMETLAGEHAKVKEIYSQAFDETVAGAYSGNLAKVRQPSFLWAMPHKTDSVLCFTEQYPYDIEPTQETIGEMTIVKTGDTYNQNNSLTLKYSQRSNSFVRASDPANVPVYCFGGKYTSAGGASTSVGNRILSDHPRFTLTTIPFAEVELSPTQKTSIGDLFGAISPLGLSVGEGVYSINESLNKELERIAKEIASAPLPNPATVEGEDQVTLIVSQGLSAEAKRRTATDFAVRTMSPMAGFITQFMNSVDHKVAEKLQP